MSKSPVHAVWNSMLQRCQNPKTKAYERYGGRGITVCDRWQVFEHFLADMGEPAAGMTLERRDNHGPYSPDNCRWATRVEQGCNKRSNRLITHNGQTLPAAEWGRKIGISGKVIRQRLDRGTSAAQALQARGAI